MLSQLGPPSMAGRHGDDSAVYLAGLVDLPAAASTLLAVAWIRGLRAGADRRRVVLLAGGAIPPGALCFWYETHCEQGTVSLPARERAAEL